MPVKKPHTIHDKPLSSLISDEVLAEYLTRIGQAYRKKEQAKIKKIKSFNYSSCCYEEGTISPGKVKLLKDYTITDTVDLNHPQQTLRDLRPRWQQELAEKRYRQPKKKTKKPE